MSTPSGPRDPRLASLTAMIFSLLDLKLALRMLFRYPGLTAMAGVSMAFAITAGAGTFEAMKQALHPTIPLPEGERIIGIQYLLDRSGRVDRRILYDLRVWRDELESVVELGAFRASARNLTPATGGTFVAEVAELDAAALALARTEPQLGRLFRVDDEASGAQPVILLSHDLWRNRFGADPDIIGTSATFGVEPATIVGVMPEGFGYPLNGDVWAPLRVGAIAGPGDGPAVSVLGRLAADASLERAREEIAAVTAGLATEFPERYATFSSHVRLLAHSYVPSPMLDAETMVALIFAGSNLPVIFFLVLVAGNIALLMFARAATRESELVVRNALGASRGRIVGQLFAEALALAALAAVVGLAAATFGLRWFYDVFQREVFGGSLPFWVRPGLSRATIVYTVGLTTLAAVVAGVLPGLKVTRSIAGGLRQASAGSGGFRFAGVWTVVIVAQVAVTVVFSFVTVSTLDDGDSIQPPQLGSPAEDYYVLTAWLEPEYEALGAVDDVRAAHTARFTRTLAALEARLEADPHVAGVTFAERALGSYHPWRQIEVDGPSAPPRWGERGHRVGSARVALDYFDVLDLPILAGRGFQPSDLEAGGSAVIVNQAFVDDILGDRNAIGARVRYIASEENRSPDQPPGPWLEIVGVVPTTGKMSGYGSTAVYHPAAPGGFERAAVTVHLPGGAGSFGAPTLAAAAAVDPELLTRELTRLDRITGDEQDFYAFWRWVMVVTSAITVLLALGGIYSVMSVTVSQRTREIGVRIALGSGRARVVGAVFRKPLAQIVAGIGAGAALLVILMLGPGEVEPDAREAVIFGAYLVLISLVCLLACVVPTRRALRIQPAEALRAE